MNLRDYGRTVLEANQGDIILISFPFSNVTDYKVRPAIVISNNLYNTSTEDVVVLAMTSNINNMKYKIKINNNDLLSGTLPLDCAIRVDKPYSLIKSKILKIQAKIKTEKFLIIIEKINALINP